MRHAANGDVYTGLTFSSSCSVLRCIRARTRSSSCSACSGTRTTVCACLCADAVQTPRRSCVDPSARPLTSVLVAPSHLSARTRDPSPRPPGKSSQTNSSPASSWWAWPHSPSSSLTCSSFSCETPRRENRKTKPQHFRRTFCRFYTLSSACFFVCRFYMLKLYFFVAQIFKLQTLHKVVNESIFYMSSNLKKKKVFLRAFVLGP